MIINNSSDVRILRMRRLISELFPVSLTDIALLKQQPTLKDLKKSNSES